MKIIITVKIKTKIKKQMKFEKYLLEWLGRRSNMCVIHDFTIRLYCD